MLIRNAALAAALAMALSSCSSTVTQPADPVTVARIVQACMADGVFVSFGGRLVLQTLPYAGQADAIIAAGIDQVCADPERFAAIVGTVEWVAKNLAGIVRSRF